MAVTLVNLTFDLADILGGNFDARRTKVWIETNVAENVLIDAAGNAVRLGDATATVGTDGTGSFVGLVATNSATNPTAFQYRVWVDYPRAGHRDRVKWDSGWFSLTATSNLADVVDSVYVPPTWQNTFTASVQTIADSAQTSANHAAASAAQASAITGLTGEDSAVALLVNTPGSATDSALKASFVGATVAAGAGIDPTGAADSTAAIQALIDAADQGDSIVFPPGLYKLASTLTIAKTLRFGGSEAATRTNVDLSNPAAGVEFVYTGTSGDAIYVQPPLPDGSGDNGRISVFLHDFHVRGNKNVVGATAGGGIKLDGRASVSACAISGFVIEDVKVSEAKGDGFTVTGDVYEGRVVGLSSFRNGGKGINVGAVAQPGETLWEDIHTSDNDGDGGYFLGPTNVQILRWSSSRNGGRGAYFKNATVTAIGLQCESNAGAEVVTVEDSNGCQLIGLNIDYVEPSYTGTGLVIKGTSQDTLVISPEFSGTATTWDLTTATTTQNTLILNPRWSAANKVSLGSTAGFDAVLSGGRVTNGVFELTSDGAANTPGRTRAASGQTDDLYHWLSSVGGVLARITASGGFRSTDDLIARLGDATQTQIGSVGPSGEAAVAIGADCSIFRRTTDQLRTNDKFLMNLGFGVGNSAAATTPGAVTKKIEVFDATGVSIGFIPVYDAIT